MVRKVIRKKLVAFSFSLFMLFCKKCPMLFHRYNFQAILMLHSQIQKFQQLSTMIRTIPHGLEDIHACKWISDNFPELLTYVLFLENCFKSIAWMAVLQSTWNDAFSS